MSGNKKRGLISSPIHQPAAETGFGALVRIISGEVTDPFFRQVFLRAIAQLPPELLIRCQRLESLAGRLENHVQDLINHPQIREEYDGIVGDPKFLAALTNIYRTDTSAKRGTMTRLLLSNATAY